MQHAGAHITQLKFRNYRSFSDEQTIQLKPLTLIFGHNNSGKSAILRLLSLTGASFSPFAPPGIHLNNDHARDANFNDLLSSLNSHLDLQLGIAACFLTDDGKPAENVEYSWKIRYAAEHLTQIVSSAQVSRGGRSLLLDWLSANVTDSERIHNLYKLTQSQGGIKESWIGFNGLVPRLDRVRRGSLEASFERLQHPQLASIRLGAARSRLKRQYPLRPNGSVTVTADGSGVPELLAQSKVLNTTLLPRVSNWYRRTFGYDIDVSLQAETFSIMFRPLKALHSVNAVDVGEGLTQVLPVVAASFYMQASSDHPQHLAIEEPDSNLHPKFHSSIIECITELIQSKHPPRILLETHSEVLLLAVQTAIATRQIDPDRVIVYWVTQRESGASYAEPITFDEFGRPLRRWPPSAFEAAVQSAKQLLNAQRERLL